MNGKRNGKDKEISSSLHPIFVVSDRSLFIYSSIYICLNTRDRHRHHRTLCGYKFEIVLSIVDQMINSKLLDVGFD